MESNIVEDNENINDAANDGNGFVNSENYSNDDNLFDTYMDRGTSENLVETNVVHK